MWDRMKRAGQKKRFSTMSLTVGLGTLCLILLVTGCSFDRAEAVREFNMGLNAYNHGETSDAIAHMEAAVQRDPTFAEASYYLGQVYQVRAQNFDAAEGAYRRALDIDPENPRYAYRLGHVQAESGQHERAINSFRTAVELEPTYARAWFAKGMSQEALGQFAEAADTYGRAIEANPRLRMAADDIGGGHYHALGDLYLRFRLFDHAARVYENGARNNPEQPRLHHGLGVAQMQLGLFDDAAESFQATLAIDPRHSSANFNLAVAHASRGDRDSAIELLERLSEGGGRGMDGPRLAAVRNLLGDLRAEIEAEEEED